MYTCTSYTISKYYTDRYIIYNKNDRIHIPYIFIYIHMCIYMYICMSRIKGKKKRGYIYPI